MRKIRSEREKETRIVTETETEWQLKLASPLASNTLATEVRNADSEVSARNAQGPASSLEGVEANGWLYVHQS